MNVKEITSRNPLILINFKTYLEATGRRAVEISREFERISRATGVSVGVAPQFADIAQVATQVDIPVFAQHTDPIGPGAFTGQVLAESLEAAGADGTILNHSERTIRLTEIQNVINHVRELQLLTVVCAGTAESAAAISLMAPDMVAIEPPELIGTGRAVSREKPEVIENAVKRIRSVNATVKILCGAGISTGDDVYAALGLGAEGFLIASGIIKAPDPGKVVLDFCAAAKRFAESK